MTIFLKRSASANKTMADYVIVTDVTVDLPAEMLTQMDIPAMPMPLVFNNNAYMHYADFREVSYANFYKSLREGGTASTSQVTNATFREYFEPYLKEGKDILYIAFSSGLSGSYNGSLSVRDALLKEYPDRKIVCVDTLAASSGEGMLVYYAAKKKDEGYSLEELALWLEEHKLHLCHWFTVDDLFFLKRGGRISATTAAIGTILKIKPVMHVDDEGHLISMEKVRSRKKALRRLIDKLLTTGTNVAEQTIFICQADALVEAQEMAETIKREAGVKEVIITEIGPIIGAHAGPGTIALFFFGEKR